MTSRYRYAPSIPPTGDPRLTEWLAREFRAVRDGMDAAAEGRMLWRGAWAAGTYQANDAVLAEGMLLIAKIATDAPPVSGTPGSWVVDPDWDLVTVSA